MLNLLTHEINYYFKNKIEIIELYCFIITSYLAFSFALSNALTAEHEVFTAGCWLVFSIACGLGAGRLFAREQQDGRLELYQLLPMQLEAVILVKWLGFYGALILTLVAAAPVALLLGGVSMNAWQWVLGGGVGLFSLSLVSVLSGILLLRTGSQAALLNLIALPLAVPTIIFGGGYFRQHELWDNSLLFMLLYGLFLLPAVTLAAASSIRSSN